MFKYQEKTIRPGKAWTDINGVQHPSNWNIWSIEEKTAIGIEEIIEESPPDGRFHRWSQNKDGTITSYEKALAPVKEYFIKEIKKRQNSILSSTDWVIIRQADNGKAIPSDVRTHRDSIRVIGDEMEAAVTGANSIAQLEALLITWDDDGNKVPCYLTTYDIVNGRKVLNVSESGLVN